MMNNRDTDQGAEHHAITFHRLNDMPNMDTERNMDIVISKFI